MFLYPWAGFAGRFQAVVQAQQPLPFRPATRVLVLQQIHRTFFTQNSPQVIGQFRCLAESDVHALRPNRPRLMRGVTNEPAPPLAELFRQPMPELHLRGPLKFLDAPFKPRRTPFQQPLQSVRAVVFVGRLLHREHAPLLFRKIAFWCRQNSLKAPPAFVI